MHEEQKLSKTAKAAIFSAAFYTIYYVYVQKGFIGFVHNLRRKTEQ